MAPIFVEAAGAELRYSTVDVNNRFVRGVVIKKIYIGLVA